MGVNLEVMSRTIVIPQEVVGMIVQGDSNSIRFTFDIARYFNGVDLSKKIIKIGYLNSNEEKGYNDCVVEEIKAKTFLFHWYAQKDATKASGEVEMWIEFSDEENSEEKRYIWKTKPTTINIEKTFEVLNNSTDKDYIAEKLFCSEYDIDAISDMVSQIPPIVLSGKELLFSEGVDFTIQGDAKSQLLTFKAERYSNGVDRSSKAIAIKYKNAKGETGRSSVVNIVVSENEIVFSWIVDGRATVKDGTVEFAVEFLGYDDNNEFYVWTSKIQTFNVVRGLSVDSVSDEPVRSWTQSLEISMDNRINNKLNELAAAKQVNSEVILARGTENSLGDRLNVTDSEVELIKKTKANTSEITRLDSQLSQSYKELKDTKADLSITNSLSTQLAQTALQTENLIELEREARIAEIATERGRITAISSLKEGSTTGDAELADIRVIGGKIYGSAGNATRSIGNLIVDSNNLLDFNNVKDGYAISPTGQEVINSSYKIMDYFIDIGDAQTIYSKIFNGTADSFTVSFYDTNLKFISRSASKFGINVSVIPNAKYIKLAVATTLATKPHVSFNPINNYFSSPLKINDSMLTDYLLRDETSSVSIKMTDFAGYGKNKLYIYETSGLKSGITYTANGSRITLNGTAQAYGQILLDIDDISDGTYTLSLCTRANVELCILSRKIDDSIVTTYEAISTSKVYTKYNLSKDSDKYTLKITFQSGAVFKDTEIAVMIEQGETPTVFEDSLYELRKKINNSSRKINEKLRVAFVPDFHFGSDVFSSAYGWQKNGNELSQEERMQFLVDTINHEHRKKPFDFVLSLGDLTVSEYSTDDTGSKEWIDKFARDYLWQIEAPFFCIPGNHDAYSNKTWIEKFGYDKNFSIETDDFYFICIANYDTNNNYTEGDLDYVNNEIVKASDKKIILCGHHYPYTQIGIWGNLQAIMRNNPNIIGVIYAHAHAWNAVTSDNNSEPIFCFYICAGSFCQPKYSWVEGFEYKNLWGITVLETKNNNLVCHQVQPAFNYDGIFQVTTDAAPITGKKYFVYNSQNNKYELVTITAFEIGTTYYNTVDYPYTIGEDVILTKGIGGGEGATFKIGKYNNNMAINDKIKSIS